MAAIAKGPFGKAKWVLTIGDSLRPSQGVSWMDIERSSREVVPASMRKRRHCFTKERGVDDVMVVPYRACHSRWRRGCGHQHHKRAHIEHGRLGEPIWVTGMDSFTDENWLVFMKTGPARFCQFTENRPVEFEIFKILRNFEIQNPKKLSFTLRILIKTEFKILLYFIVEKSRQVQWVLKLKKIILIGFIATSYSVHRYVSTHLISSFPY
jgi:hypothetical protein